MLGKAKLKGLDKPKCMVIKDGRNEPYQSRKSKKVEDDRNENEKCKFHLGFGGIHKKQLQIPKRKENPPIGTEQ
jgi:hypothetical protein